MIQNYISKVQYNISSFHWPLLNVLEQIYHIYDLKRMFKFHWAFKLGHWNKWCQLECYIRIQCTQKNACFVFEDVSYSSYSDTHTHTHTQTECPLECWPRAGGWNSKVEGKSTVGKQRKREVVRGMTVWKIQHGAATLCDQGISWRKYRHYYCTQRLL